MPIRKTLLKNGYFYHIFSRGANRMPIFQSKRDFQRFINLVDYYRFADCQIKYSHLKTLSTETREEIKSNLKEKLIGIISYCLMPNHFHFVLRQEKDSGISTFMRNLLTSYSKYFNTKHQRTGPMFEGRFKSVLVETEEQLKHLVRYIHLNPYSSGIVRDTKELLDYPWSSLKEYLESKATETSDKKEIILKLFKSKEDFKKFTLNQAKYQKNLEKIKHLIQE